MKAWRPFLYLVPTLQCAAPHADAKPNRKYAVTHSDAEWKKILSPEQYRVLREKGTERAFTGAYYNSHDKAIYVCAACGQQLFGSDKKFDSGTGWPSFSAPVDDKAVESDSDSSLGMVRTEVRCARC